MRANTAHFTEIDFLILSHLTEMDVLKWTLRSNELLNILGKKKLNK